MGVTVPVAVVFTQMYDILITYLIHHAFRLLRAIAGETNLSDRTQVDARFLF